MSIGQYPDLSTAHVTKQDMDYLQDAGRNGSMFLPVIASYPEGVICYATDDLDETEIAEITERVSESFVKVLRYARDHGCYLIRLDADGDAIEDPALDHHEW